MTDSVDSELAKAEAARAAAAAAVKAEQCLELSPEKVVGFSTLPFQEISSLWNIY